MLRVKASSLVELNGPVPDRAIKLYSDASGFGAGCVILQDRPVALVSGGGESSGARDPVEDPIETAVPILYDSFLFTKTQRAYGTYKKELCAIVEFCRR
ncbi:hypothetical protein CDD82_2555 [Ophiocordyceps australis]|uniref:Reverse transcriptase RNase H-like domain-containing protein n=1 Tax=Ophiocordyceps australis TaxID=1399860 RepID=A0A2C5XWU9_9HYPO|nr:hypothetical protein CDD82_2555 [Ophiocordyceps australis]